MLMIVWKKKKMSVISKITCECLFNYHHNSYDANKKITVAKCSNRISIICRAMKYIEKEKKYSCY